MLERLDHLVLTTTDEAACVAFYTQLLGMRLETFVGGAPLAERKAFRFGRQKINLHVRGREFEPKASRTTPGSLDLCFIAARPLREVIARIEAYPWPILEGPVQRTGAESRLLSIYLRDPDGNLIEISEEIPEASRKT